jgi:hypothetical protein
MVLRVRDGGAFNLSKRLSKKRFTRERSVIYLMPKTFATSVMPQLQSAMIASNFLAANALLPGFFSSDFADSAGSGHNSNDFPDMLTSLINFNTLYYNIIDKISQPLFAV